MLYLDPAQRQPLYLLFSAGSNLNKTPQLNCHQFAVSCWGSWLVLRGDRKNGREEDSSSEGKSQIPPHPQEQICFRQSHSGQHWGGLLCLLGSPWTWWKLHSHLRPNSGSEASKLSQTREVGNAALWLREQGWPQTDPALNLNSPSYYTCGLASPSSSFVIVKWLE